MEMQRIVPVLAGLTENSSNDERKQVAFETLFKIRNVTIATVDGDKPAARTYDCAQLDDGNIYFTVVTGKPSYKQIQKNPYIVMNAWAPGYPMIRIGGPVIEKMDQDTQDQYYEINKGTKALYEKSPDVARIFTFVKGEGELFDIAGYNQTVRLRFGFGGMQPRKMLYSINLAKCTSCGECEKVCVGNAIEKGIPYEINEMECLECGSCYNVCPVGAVRITE
jgi:uncharacterized pyridoxamine 5'-phosphate oxidase family protein